MWITLLLAGCTPEIEWAEPADFERSGPGIGATSFSEAELFEPCAHLTGGEGDAEHYNLVSMFDGYLVFPWAPEFGGGGISLLDMSAPCTPTEVGQGRSDLMRESHTLSFGEVDGRRYVAVDYHQDPADENSTSLGGIGIFDITDPTSPQWVSELALPNYSYPDSYFFVTVSTFWQGDVLYVAGGFNGIFMVDVSDPTAPSLLSQTDFEPPGLLVGSIHAIGNVAMVSSFGLARTVMMDISDPTAPTVIPGGDFLVSDPDGDVQNYYFATVGGEYGLFARKNAGGGPVLYDLRDPSDPTLVGAALNEDGSGGYAYRHEDRLFQGDSNFGSVYDISDPSAPVELHRVQMKGDLDTITPMGNLAVAAVDSAAEPGKGTSVFAWQSAPDTRGPLAKLHFPEDGALHVPLTSRIGLSFDEWLEPVSAHAGSLRVWSSEHEAVPGRFNVQEGIVNFTPSAPLLPDTTYFVSLQTGGITDVSGNPVEVPLDFAFSTGAELDLPRR